MCLRCGILSTVFQCPDECVDLTPSQAGQSLTKGFIALSLCRLPLFLSDLLRQIYLLCRSWLGTVTAVCGLVLWPFRSLNRVLTEIGFCLCVRRITLG